MRVACILPSYAASDDDWCIPVIRNTIESLAVDAEPVVYALHYPYQRSTYSVHGITVHCLSQGKQNGIDRLRLWRELMRGVERDHMHAPFDLVHAFWGTETGYFATRIAKRLRLPSIVSLAGGELARLKLQQYGAQLFPWLRYFVSRSMADATMLTVGSEWLVERVPIAHHRKLRCIPLGVDTGMFLPAPERCGHKLLAAASLQPLKDYPTLLGAVAVVRESFPDLTLTIAGYSDTAEALRLRQLVSELKLDDAVRFLGEVPYDQMPPLFASHDLLLHSSLWEAQGMVILEGLATGLPAVSSHVGIAATLPDRLVPTFTPGDVGAMTSVISASLATHHHAQTALQEGPAYMQQHYSLDRAAGQFYQLYDQQVHQPASVVAPAV
jgi:glycosyltransferase involved in cell wall biosynthesis